jgi:hypothetical protein
MSTKEETPKSSNKPENGGDLEAFQPSPPSVRLDDKAASFVIVILSSALVGPHLSGAVLFFFLLSLLILLISLGEYWDFPWAVGPLMDWTESSFKSVS